MTPTSPRPAAWTTRPRARLPRRPRGAAEQATGKVGVILPDTTSSTRYELYDKPLLEKALTDAGITADVQNAQGDKNKFASIAQSMIGEGFKVLIIDSIDAASGAGVERWRPRPASRSSTTTASTSAAPRRTTSPSTTRTSASSRPRPWSTASTPGRRQAQDHHDERRHRRRQQRGAVPEGRARGLRPAGGRRASSRSSEEATVKGWKIENAAPAFNQALTAAGSDVQGVLAANDDIANAVIGVLKKQVPTARSSSPARTPASRACRTSSPASRA